MGDLLLLLLLLLGGIRRGLARGLVELKAREGLLHPKKTTLLHRLVLKVGCLLKPRLKLRLKLRLRLRLWQ